MKSLRRPSHARVEAQPPPTPAILAIRVVGRPAPQGSKNALGMEASRFLEPWRNDVRMACEVVIDRYELAQITGPVRVGIVFLLAGPPKIDPDRVYPLGNPDLDKLIRGVLDSITHSGLWKDDNQVVEFGRVAKEYAGSIDTGASIEIEELT